MVFDYELIITNPQEDNNAGRLTSRLSQAKTAPDKNSIVHSVTSFPEVFLFQPGMLLHQCCFRPTVADTQITSGMRAGKNKQCQGVHNMLIQKRMVLFGQNREPHEKH